jgi:hypothetical protein
MTRLRAHFDGKVLIPEGPVDLPRDCTLEIQVSESVGPRPGSPEAILRAMDSGPNVTKEDVDELERAIESGKIRARPEGEFDQDAGA